MMMPCKENQKGGKSINMKELKKVVLALSEEQYQIAKKGADQQGVSVQDYIRQKAFGEELDIYTPAEAVRRVMQLEKGACFTLVSLYGLDWNLQRGASGVFGRQFFQYVQKNYSDQIQFLGKLDGRNAHYKKIV